MSEPTTPKNNLERFPGQGTEVPIIHPTVIQQGHSSNEFILVLSQTILIFDDTELTAGKGTVTPVGVLQMSPQTAKDLYLVLQEGIRQYEKEYGPINTTYSQSLEKTGE